MEAEELESEFAKKQYDAMQSQYGGSSSRKGSTEREFEEECARFEKQWQGIYKRETGALVIEAESRTRANAETCAKEAAAYARAAYVMKSGALAAAAAPKAAVAAAAAAAAADVDPDAMEIDGAATRGESDATAAVARVAAAMPAVPPSAWPAWLLAAAAPSTSMGLTMRLDVKGGGVSHRVACTEGGGGDDDDGDDAERQALELEWVPCTTRDAASGHLRPVELAPAADGAVELQREAVAPFGGVELEAVTIAFAADDAELRISLAISPSNRIVRGALCELWRHARSEQTAAAPLLSADRSCSGGVLGTSRQPRAAWLARWRDVCARGSPMDWCAAGSLLYSCSVSEALRGGEQRSCVTLLYAKGSVAVCGIRLG